MLEDLVHEHTVKRTVGEGEGVAVIDQELSAGTLREVAYSTRGAPTSKPTTCSGPGGEEGLYITTVRTAEVEPAARHILSHLTDTVGDIEWGRSEFPESAHRRRPQGHGTRKGHCPHLEELRFPTLAPRLTRGVCLVTTPNCRSQ